MCEICNRIDMAKEGESPYFFRELETGYVFINDYQHFYGSVCFICKKHVNELYELDPEYRLKFLDEMSRICKCIKYSFSCDTVNFEISGNNPSHLKFDIYPRNKGDLEGFGIGGTGSVWYLPMDLMFSSVPDTLMLSDIKEKLNVSFDMEF